MYCNPTPEGQARRPTPAMEVPPHVDMYTRLPPEEQKVIQVTLLAAAATLWFALAWEEVMVLFALPALAVLAYSLIRVARKHAERRKEDILY